MTKQEISVKPSGNSFIDGNHESLLEHLIELSSIVSSNFEPDKFRLIIEDLILSIENHFSHEETILRGIGYTNLRAHTIQHRTMALDLHTYLAEDLSKKETAKFMQKMVTSVISHEMLMDQDYWSYFDDNPSDKAGLISWQPEFETGNKEADWHHQSLINHVNRFYIKLIDSNDIDMACSELKLLCAYSEHHFQEEERLLGERLRLGHKEQHQKLLDDLGVVIDEIKAGKFKLNNLGGYLDFWLINHIKMYDLPAFSSN